MTTTQLDKLAGVMGWRKERRTFWTSSFRYAEVNDWCWVDDKNTVQPVDYWIPHESLNQALPLLDAFNEKASPVKRIHLQYSPDTQQWQIYGLYNRMGNPTFTQEIIASEICNAILERLDIGALKGVS